jgi:hypothetical protein
LRQRVVDNACIAENTAERTSLGLLEDRKRVDGLRHAVAGDAEGKYGQKPRRDKAGYGQNPAMPASFFGEDHEPKVPRSTGRWSSTGLCEERREKDFPCNCLGERQGNRGRAE